MVKLTVGLQKTKNMSKLQHSLEPLSDNVDREEIQSPDVMHSSNTLEVQEPAAGFAIGITEGPEEVKSDSIDEADADAIEDEAQSDDFVFAGDSEEGEFFYLPNSVYNSLYPYQQDAVEWLWSLHCMKVGGVLADDMGLGKSRMVSAFLRGLFHSGIIERAIIVMPASLPDGWVEELGNVGLQNIMRFTDATNGHHWCALNTVLENGGILLTTMEMFRKHHSFILKKGQIKRVWDYFFIDEGHKAKNKKTLLYESLSNVDTEHKIVLTGTPIQNDLKEFFNIMEFCCPGVLGDYETFNKEYRRPIERGKHIDVTTKKRNESTQAFDGLKELIDPFLFRRTKDILKAQGRLFEKYELVIWLKLAQPQRQLIKKLFDKMTLNAANDSFQLSGRLIAQDICNHPLLLMESSEQSKEKVPQTDVIRKILLDKYPIENLLFEDFSISCKISFILYLVPKLVTQGHKVLIFSESPKMLELVENALRTTMEEKKIIRMDGKTPLKARAKLIKEFQPPKVKSRCPDSPSSFQEDEASPTVERPSIFLLSTKSSGFGLTLTNASRVVLIEPSSNPATDNQAMDRAYRVGQKKDVVVYRLVSCGTPEERHYEDQIKRDETANSIYGEQRRRIFEKKKCRVLKIPEKGFDISTTHLELTAVCGNKFHESVEQHVQFIKGHEYVFDVFNHNLLSLATEAARAPIAQDELSSPSASDSLDYPPPTQARVRFANELQGKGHSTLIGPSCFQSRLHGPIKKIEIPCERDHRSGAKIKESNNNEAEPDALTQVVELSGTPEKAGRAERLTNDVLAKADVSKEQTQNAKLVSETVGREAHGGSPCNGSNGRKYHAPQPQQLMKIPSDKVGLLIGKGGHAIKFIQMTSGARIKVDPSQGDQSERTVLIDGTKEQVESAKQLIMNRVINSEAHAGSSCNGSKDRKYRAPQPQPELMTIPSDKVGLLIGKGGHAIKFIQMTSGARIKVDPSDVPPGDQSERIVLINGTKEQVESAKQLIMNRIINSENQPMGQMPGGCSPQGYRPDCTQANCQPVVQPRAPLPQQPGPLPCAAQYDGSQVGRDTRNPISTTQYGFCPPPSQANWRHPGEYSGYQTQGQQPSYMQPFAQGQGLPPGQPGYVAPHHGAARGQGLAPRQAYGAPPVYPGAGQGLGLPPRQPYGAPPPYPGAAQGLGLPPRQPYGAPPPYQGYGAPPPYPGAAQGLGLPPRQPYGAPPPYPGAAQEPPRQPYGAFPPFM